MLHSINPRGPRFGSQQWAANFLSGVLQSDLTFSRASGATYTSSSGIITTVANDVPRFDNVYDHDDTISAGANQIIYPENLESWTLYNGNVSVDLANDSLGNPTLDKVYSNTSTTVHEIYTSTSSIAGTSYTYSVEARAAEHSIFQLAMTGGVPSTCWANFNLAAGTVGNSGGGATASITALGGGLYRCELTVVPTLTTTTSCFIVITNNTDTSSRFPSFTGDGVSGIYAGKAYKGVTAGTIAVTLQRGLLVEGASTNMALYSEDFTQATYAKIRCSVTGGQSGAPDSAATLNKIIEDTNAGTHGTAQNIMLVNGTTYTYSIFVKAGTRDQVRIQVDHNSATAFAITLDLTASSVLSSSGTCGYEKCANGFYRIWGTFTATANAIGTFWVYMYNLAGGGVTYTGDGASYLYAWGTQVEALAFKSSYIKSTSAATTRAADIVTQNALSAMGYNADVGTLLISGTVMGVRASTGSVLSRICQFDDGTDANKIAAIHRHTNGVMRGDFTVSASDVANVGSTAITANTHFKFAIGWEVNNFASSVNGGAVSTDVTGTVPSGISAFRIGSDGAGTSNFFGWLESITYFQSRFPNTSLISLTV